MTRAYHDSRRPRVRVTSMSKQYAHGTPTALAVRECPRQVERHPCLSASSPSSAPFAAAPSAPPLLRLSLPKRPLQGQTCNTAIHEEGGMGTCRAECLGGRSSRWCPHIFLSFSAPSGSSPPSSGSSRSGSRSSPSSFRCRPPKIPKRLGDVGIRPAGT